MKRTWFLRVRCLSFAALMSCVCFAQDDDFTEQEKQQGFTMLQQLSLADRARFVLNGKVVNQEGNPLDDVKVICDVARNTDGWGQQDRTTTTRLVSGTFSLEFENVSAVTLTFSREGYRKAKLAFTCSLSKEDEETILAGGVVEPPDITTNDLTVVLHEIGDQAELQDYSPVLEYRVGGEAVIVNLATPPHQKNGMEPVQNIHEKDQLPDSAIYATAATNENGHLSTVSISNPNTGMSFAYPQEVRLTTSDTNGGFVVFTVEEGVPVAAQMTTAPDTGYTQEIVLSAQQFADMVQHGFPNDLSWFFFKVQNKYGKGTFGLPDLKNGNTRLKLPLDLGIQPDGSRNVETAE